jgi:hypothetical protein
VVAFAGRSLIGIAVAGVIAAMEAIRLAGARATVSDGWSAGIAAGAGSGLALATLIAVIVLVTRLHGRPWHGGWPLFIVILTTALLNIVAIFTSTPPRQHGPHPPPYIVTTGIEVAEIALIGMSLALLTVLIAGWTVVALIRDNLLD